MSKDKKYNYLYKITNNLTGQYYIGIHSTDSLEKDRYFGSGKYISRAIKRYGKLSFTKEILEFYPNRQALSEAESAYVTEDLLRDPLCYNLRTGGDSGASSSLTEGGKNQIRQTLLEKNARWMSKGNDSFLVPQEDFSSFLEKGYSFGRGKNRPKKGLVYVHNGTVNRSVPKESLQKYLNEGWKKGRFSAPNKGKIVIQKEGQTRYISSEDLSKYEKLGWRKGNSNLRIRYSQKTPFCKGTRKVMTDGNSFKFIPVDEVPGYLANGWMLGKKFPKAVAIAREDYE